MRNGLILMAALAVIVAVTYILQTATPAVQPVPVIDEHSYDAAPMVPIFTLPDLAGRARTVPAEGMGNTVLLHFWATWCAPCVREIPSLIALARDRGDQVHIWAVSVDRDAKTVTDFLTRNRFTLPDNMVVLMDSGKAVSQDVFQTYRYPETIIIDPKGRMIRKIAGDQDWSDTALRAQIFPTP